MCARRRCFAGSDVAGATSRWGLRPQHIRLRANVAGDCSLPTYPGTGSALSPGLFIYFGSYYPLQQIPFVKIEVVSLQPCSKLFGKCPMSMVLCLCGNILLDGINVIVADRECTISVLPRKIAMLLFVLHPKRCTPFQLLNYVGHCRPTTLHTQNVYMIAHPSHCDDAAIHIVEYSADIGKQFSHIIGRYEFFPVFGAEYNVHIYSRQRLWHILRSFFAKIYKPGLSELCERARVCARRRCFAGSDVAGATPRWGLRPQHIRCKANAAGKHSHPAHPGTGSALSPGLFIISAPHTVLARAYLCIRRLRRGV